MSLWCFPFVETMRITITISNQIHDIFSQTDKRFFLPGRTKGSAVNDHVVESSFFPG